MWLTESLYAQTTFNRQLDLEYQYNLLTGVLPTDSCYYVNGLVTDTADQSYRLGMLFLKLDTLGEITIEKEYSSDQTWYQPWRGDLTFDGEGNLYNVGDKADTVQSVYWVKFNTLGDTLFTKTYLNPLFPADDFIRAASIKQKENGNMYILCGIDNNPSAGNADIFLLEIDKEGLVVGFYTYGESTVTEVPYSLLVDDDGGAIIGANKTNWGFVTKNFYSRTYIVKVDTMGKAVWQYQTDQNDLFDIAYDMIKTPDGGVGYSNG